MTFTNKEASSQLLTQADQRRQKYEQQELKSIAYRNRKNDGTYARRARTPPLPVDHPELEPLFPLRRSGLPLPKNFTGMTNFRLPQKFSSSESVTLSPRSVGSERSVMDLSLLGDCEYRASMNSESSDKSAMLRERRENAMKTELQELRLRRGRLLLQMESAKQEAEEDKVNDEIYYMLEIAKNRKRSLQAHFNMVPQETETPELVKMPIEQRREFKETSEPKVDEVRCTEKRIIQMSNIDKFLVDQVHLKKKLNKDIKLRGFIKETQRQRVITFQRKALIISEIKRESTAIQEKVGLRFDLTSNSLNVRKIERMVAEVLLRQKRKATISKDIQKKERQIVLKTHINQVIKTQGLKVKLMSELSQYVLKRKLTQLARANHRWQTPSELSNVNCALRRIRRKLIERSRLKEAKRRLAKNFRQIGKTRLLKKRVNCVLKTHYRKAVVVKDIWTRGQTVRNKACLLKEFRVYMARREKLRLERQFSWRRQRERLHRDLSEYFAGRKRELKKLWFQMMERGLKLEELEIRQRKLKNKMLRDLLIRFQTVDLKARLCRDIMEHARIKMHRRQVLSVIKQRALKREVNQKILEQKWHLKKAEPEMKLFTNFILKDKYSAIKKTRRLKHKINKPIEKMSLEKTRNILAYQLQASDMRQTKEEKVRIFNTRARLQRIRQKYLKARVVSQITIMGQKMRVVEQIKKKNYSILVRNKSGSQSKRTNTYLMELENKVGFENLDDVPMVTSDLPIKTHYSSYTEFKEVWEDIKVQNKLNKENRRREVLRLRTEVDKRKAIVNMELKMRYAKVKCMIAIRGRAQARRNHLAVCQEINQRRNLARCLQDIKSGSYYLTHVPMPIKTHSLVMFKQQMHKRNVNTVLNQAGRKIKLHNEILGRQAQRNRKALVIADITFRFGTARVCAEIRLRAKQKADASKNHKATLQELKQRYRHIELVKELKTRRKQIFWKKNTCIIIKQGRNKSLVNNEIRAFARQKYLKKQINTTIRQGALKSRVQKEIRQIRAIMELKKQRTLKAQVNLAIRQLAESHAGKRRVCMVLKQKGLKERSKGKIGCQEYYLKSRHSQQQVPSPLQIKEQREILSKKKKLSASSSTVVENWDSVCGKNELKKGISVMKLVDVVTKARKLKEQQDKDIRSLTALVEQQKADFASLSMRVVEDKNRLYQKLEDLKQENEILTELLAKQEQEELDKTWQKAQVKQMKRQNYNEKRQQATRSYQMMQESSKSDLSRSKTHQLYFLEPNRQSQVFF